MKLNKFNNLFEKHLSYLDIGNNDNNNVDIWISCGDDYNVIPNVYTPIPNRNDVHLRESSAELAGRIDHDTKKISMRTGRLLVSENFINYMGSVIKADYPEYEIWFFSNNTRGPKQLC
jgi:hypothetical protein